MTLTSSPPVEVAPEVRTALDRLARCDPLLVSDELRSVTLRAAETAAFTREAQSHVTECREAVEAATAARDMHAAVIASERLAAAERLIPLLPVIADDGSAEPCLAIARQRIDQAAGMIQEPPVSSASAEMAAYRSLPPQFLADVEPPSLTREDRQLAAAIEAWSERQRSIRDGIASWRRSVELRMNDPLDLLASVASLIQTAEDVTRDGAALAVQVNAANVQRREREDEWQQVSRRNPVVSQHLTAATKTLAKHRAAMAAGHGMTFTGSPIHPKE